MGSSKYPRAMAEYLQSMASPAVYCVRASDDDDGDGDVAVVDEEEEDIVFTVVEWPCGCGLHQNPSNSLV
jgi:hypothetical protein